MVARRRGPPLLRSTLVEHCSHERLASRGAARATAARTAGAGLVVGERRSVLPARAGGEPGGPTATAALALPSPFTAYSPYAPMAQATSNNGLAIASLVLGILWVYWIGSILALIFGYVAKGQIDRSAGRQTGRGMAIAGIVLGWIGVAVLALVIVLAVAFADDLDDINTDPSDGFCNEERFLEDPDC